jgi:Trp operon repressor
MENIQTERESIEVRTLASSLAITLAQDTRGSQTVRQPPSVMMMWLVTSLLAHL